MVHEQEQLPGLELRLQLRLQSLDVQTLLR